MESQVEGTEWPLKDVHVPILRTYEYATWQRGIKVANQLALS